jgi:hypothetical protein
MGALGHSSSIRKFAAGVGWGAWEKRIAIARSLPIRKLLKTHEVGMKDGSICDPNPVNSVGLDWAVGQSVAIFVEGQRSGS